MLPEMDPEERPGAPDCERVKIGKGERKRVKVGEWGGKEGGRKGEGKREEKIGVRGGEVEDKREQRGYKVVGGGEGKENKRR